MGHNVFSIGKFLVNKIKQIDPDEIFFVGNSMRGYASHDNQGMKIQTINNTFSKRLYQ